MSGGVIFWIGTAFGIALGLILSALLRSAKDADESAGYVRMADRCKFWNDAAWNVGKAPCGHAICGAGSTLGDSK